MCLDAILKHLCKKKQVRIEELLLRIRTLQQKNGNLSRKLKDKEERLEFLEKMTDEKVISQLYECKLCFERRVTTVFLPCGHTMSCMNCAKNIETCPICDSVIDAKTMIHFM
jgi:rubrerythrin